MPRLTGPRTPVFVTISGGKKYGYLMDEQSFNALKSSCGITAAIAELGVFYGAQSPRPGRAIKKESTGTQSSFYSDDKAKDLKKAGWKLTSPPSIRAPLETTLTVPVGVTTPRGYIYAWLITKADKGMVTELGGKVLTAADFTDCVWGSEPKPPRARKKTGSVTKSTFCVPTEAGIQKAVAAGYSVSGLDDDWLN